MDVITCQGGTNIWFLVVWTFGVKLVPCTSLVSISGCISATQKQMRFDETMK